MWYLETDERENQTIHALASVVHETGEAPLHRSIQHLTYLKAEIKEQIVINAKGKQIPNEKYERNSYLFLCYILFSNMNYMLCKFHKSMVLKIH